MSRPSNCTIDKCHHCGSKDGYYTKQQAHGTVIYNYNFDGSEAENGSMYDNLNYTGGKAAYCVNCGKKLFNMPK